MRYSTVGLLATLASTVLAQDAVPDLLFIDSLLYGEYVEATEDLGFTASVVDEATWRNMTTEDFAQYKAIILSDPDCGDISNIAFLEDTRTVWSPAVTGNMILIGTDPTRHLGTGGAEQLMRNSIQFAAYGDGNNNGSLATGLYFSLSCYYNDVDTATVTSLDQFGDFEVRGNLSCYNDIHLVAQSAALDSLGDADLSNWDCSVHEAFSSYPSTGVNGFNALAIANNVLGLGSQSFADGSMGLPYIVSRGAIPVGCGDGVWQGSYGEECDDGANNGSDGICSATCRCVSNVPNGDGTCGPAVCGDGILSPGEQCDDGNTTDGDGCSSTCQCESGVSNGDGTCGAAPVSNTTVLTSTSIVIATSTSVTVVTSTADDGNDGADGGLTSVTSSSSVLANPTSSTTSASSSNDTISTTASPASSASTADAGSTSTSGSGLTSAGSSTSGISTAAPGQQSTSVVITTVPVSTTVYIRPSCPTTSLMVGAEIIVYVSTDGPSTAACSTMQRPIYDYPRPGLPCYACEMSSEGIYPSAGGYGFMTVSTTACPSCYGGALPTPVLPVLYTAPGCAGQTMSSSAPWYGSMPTGGAQGAVPYVTPSPHIHQAPSSYANGAATGATQAATPANNGGNNAYVGATNAAATNAAATNAVATNAVATNAAAANAAATNAATAPYPVSPAANNQAASVAGVAAAGSGTGAATYPTSSVLTFQGGANTVNIAFGAIVGAVLGLAALL